MKNPAGEITPRSTEGGADIDKMLNDKKFLEAFSAQKDLDVENLDLTEGNEDLKEKYEAFQESKKVSKELTKLCEDQIFKEAKIKLDKKEFEGIEKFLGEQVFENPKMIENLREQMAQFKELPEMIAKKEADIEELTSGRVGDVVKGLENAKKKSLDEKNNVDFERRNKVKAIKEKAWFFRKTRAKRTENKYKGTINDLDIEISQITDNIKEIKDVSRMREEAQAKFQEYRTMIFQEIAPVKDIFEKAREAAQNKIKELGDPSKDLASSEEAAKYLQELKISAESKEGSGHNFLEGFEFKEGEDAEESLDEQIKGKITTELLFRIQKNEIGSKPLADFEGKLSDLIHKKEIGSMDEEKSKKWIVEELDMLRKSQTSFGMIDKAKIMLLNRIIIKLKSAV